MASVNIVFLALQTPTVNLIAVTEDTLNFTWNEYQHCNNDSVLVEYEYELRQRSPPTKIYSGRESNTTSISFNNLKSDTEYQYRMRVYAINLLTGIWRYSLFGQAYGKTTLVYGM